MGTDNQIDAPLTLKQAEDILSALPIGAMFIDSNGQIFSCNDLLNNMLEKDTPSIIGLDAEQLIFSSLGKSFHSYVSEFFTPSNPLQKMAPQHFYITSESGQSIPILMGLKPVLIDKHRCMLISLADANNRIQGDLLFERSIEAAPNGILLVNNLGDITFANQSLCDCFGYTKEDVVGNNLGMLIPHRYRHNHQGQRESFWKNPSVRLMGSGRDLTALHADGREFPVEIGLSPLNIEQQLTLVTLTDITLRKRMELELKEININLEEFTYVASHDLRTPLRGISDLLE
jgi:PAS domain S-box-containing protein